ncbi:MAG: cation transporter [Deltaproteobacteria bacterium]|nr:cation transporter [Deltaproteobacteria bacterium]
MAEKTTLITLLIDGMHCGGCVRRVKKAIESVPDTRLDAVEVEVGRAEIRIAQAVDANGNANGNANANATTVGEASGLEATFVREIEALGFTARPA